MITSADEFVHLRTSEDPALYHRAGHEDAPLEVWHEVIARYPDMKEWVVRNKSVPLSILEEMADDSDVNIRYEVAMKRKLNERLFVKLATDPNSSVRERIAWNAKAPRSVLEILANDEDTEIAEKAKERLATEFSHE